MSYTVAQPQARPRPGVVSAAVALMWSVVALEVVSILLSFVPPPELDSALEEYYADHPELDTSGFESATAAIGIAIVAIIVIAFAVLAIFVGKGSQPARIVTWILSGIGALCLGCGAVFSAAGPSLLTSAAGSSPEADAQLELARIITENTPGWLTTVSTLISVLAVIALVLIIILLALPASNDFFRKEEQVWVPPTDYTGGGFPQTPPPGVPQNPPYPPAQ